MEEDILYDSIDDIISVLNTKKNNDKKGVSSIQQLIDQCVKNDIFEIENILNTGTKKEVSTKPVRGYSTNHADLLSDKISKMYINPPKPTYSFLHSRNSAPNSKTATIENLKNPFSTKKQENHEDKNLTYHEKAPG